MWRMRGLALDGTDEPVSREARFTDANEDRQQCMADGRSAESNMTTNKTAITFTADSTEPQNVRIRTS